MWATHPTIVPLLPSPSPSPTPSPSPFQRRGQPYLTTVAAAASPKEVGGLGQAVLSALNSNPTTTQYKNNPSSKPKAGKKEDKGKELSGSDILRAVAAAASPKEVGGLGQAVLSALNSNPTTTQNKNNPSSKPKARKKEDKGKELSGSVILRALQKANVKKAQVSTTKKLQQRGNGSVGGLKGENNTKRVVDYDKVGPIVVKSDWVTRLDELDKRLQEFLNI